ncbi:hypothetical protein QOZ80_4BG0333570 [Eleusine coracana subsp. coracana]|nr:hypothetical protein QOZ80_4BG0333570 [Eleusine coracana subsp. coracana]
MLNSLSVVGWTYQSNPILVMYQNIIDADGKFYYTYSVSDSSQYTRISLDYSGRMRILSWNNNTLSWTVIAENGNGCERYASCGPFGYCDLTGAVPACRCPNGFEFVDGLNFSRGC